MQHIFLTEDLLISSRWHEAFPSAEIHALVSHQYDFLLQHISFDAASICWILNNRHLKQSTLKSIVARSGSVIVMTTSETATEGRQIIELGASGYLHYLSPAALLTQAVQVVEQGGLWLGADLMRQIVFATAKQINASSIYPSLDLLTEREKHVADLVSSGKTNKEIARDLIITERTVKAHMSAIFEKLQVRDRLQLVLKMSGK